VVSKGSTSPVSIHPSTFTDDLPDLSKMSLEEVVLRFKDVEKKRNSRVEPDGEQEVFWAIRHAPVELISSIKVASEHLGVSRAVLTKCMSRQVADWYSNSLGLGDLVSTYKEIYAKIKRRTYTVLRIQAENPSKFSFAQQPELISASVNTIRWVVAKLDDIHVVVGMNVTDLLLAGFCWSLTTLDNCDWDSENVIHSFQPEVDNIGDILKCRMIDVRGLYTKYQMFEEIRVERKNRSVS